LLKEAKAAPVKVPAKQNEPLFEVTFAVNSGALQAAYADEPT
jgi:hypothetical protein